jgi:hypothetical protein
MSSGHDDRRVGHPGNAPGRLVWDLCPDDGSEPVHTWLHAVEAAERIERGKGRFVYFIDGDDVAPPRRRCLPA